MNAPRAGQYEKSQVEQPNEETHLEEYDAGYIPDEPDQDFVRCILSCAFDFYESQVKSQVKSQVESEEAGQYEKSQVKSEEPSNEQIIVCKANEIRNLLGYLRPTEQSVVLKELLVLILGE